MMISYFLFPSPRWSVHAVSPAPSFCTALTAAILLSSLVPCSLISLQDQQRIIYCAYTSGRCSDVMEQNPLVDENNVKHILRQFRRYWKERILSLCLLVADELVLPCFSRFSMQFMQVRHIQNVLFHLPT